MRRRGGARLGGRRNRLREAAGADRRTESQSCRSESESGRGRQEGRRSAREVAGPRNRKLQAHARERQTRTEALIALNAPRDRNRGTIMFGKTQFQRR